MPAFPIYVVRMKALREKKHCSQNKIAEILDTSQTMYARYERYANDMPIKHLITLCKFYNVSSDYILGLTDEQ